MPPGIETLAHAIDRVRNLQYAGYKDKETHTFGIVVECSLPRSTRGRDFVVNIYLVDDSMHAAGGSEPVELIIFSPAAENMPMAMIGDIMELRHVVVQFWEPPNGGPKKPQLFAKMNKPHPFGFVLYRLSTPPLSQDPAATAAAAAAAAGQPLQVYNTTHIGGQQTADKLAQLLAFKSTIMQPGTAVPESGTTYLRKIKDLGVPEDPLDRPECVDMRVKVLAIDKRNAEEEIVLYVWDATDARPLPADLVVLPSQWKGVELRVQRSKRRMMPLNSQLPGLQVLEQLPPLGTAMPVVMEPGAVPRVRLPSVGDWVKLKVVGLTAAQGQLQVVFGSSSRLTISQQSAGFDAYYEDRLADNTKTSEWPLERANIATRCTRADLQRVTIRQVQLQVAQQHPGPFRVQVRLIGYLPRQLQQWCKLMSRPSGDGVPQQQQQKWEWAVHLLLEDATGDLRALLLGQEATRVLGLPPTDLTGHQQDVQQLQHRLDALSAVDQEGGVWMDVALTPVYTAGPQPPQQQRQQQQEQQGEGQQQQGDQQLQQQQHGGEGSQQQGDGNQHQQQQQGQSPQTHGSQQQEAAQHGVQQAAAAAAAAGQEQQQQQPGPTGPAAAGGSEGDGAAAAGPGRQCLFILHDAVCPHMEPEQQQQHATPDADGEPSQKRQRQGDAPAEDAAGAETTSGGADNGAQRPILQQPSREAQERCMMAFM